jgi:hypothetical protein
MDMNRAEFPRSSEQQDLECSGLSEGFLAGIPVKLSVNCIHSNHVARAVHVENLSNVGFAKSHRDHDHIP